MQDGRITFLCSHIDAVAIGNGVADTCHTYGVLTRRLEAVEPTGKVAQHLIVIGPSAAETETMSACRINAHGTLVSLLTHTGIIGHAIGYRRNSPIIVGQEDDGTRCEMTANLFLG